MLKILLSVFGRIMRRCSLRPECATWLVRFSISWMMAPTSSSVIFSRRKIGRIDLWEHALLIDIQPPRASYYLSTDHSVGNRILIHQDDFSLLNGANFKEKQKLFCGSSDNMHKSCRFLQTIRIFYEYRDWNEISFVRNVMNIVTQLKNDCRAICEELNRRKRRRYKYWLF